MLPDKRQIHRTSFRSSRGLSGPDTEISFETAKTPDVRELMGEYLSEQEISQLERISSMPDADTIAQQAKDEAEAAYLAEKRPWLKSRKAGKCLLPMR